MSDLDYNMKKTPDHLEMRGAWNLEYMHRFGKEGRGGGKRVPFVQDSESRKLLSWSQMNYRAGMRLGCQARFK